MRQLRLAALIAFVILSITAALDARQQTPAPATTPMTPSAPHEKMAFFVGTWTMDALPPEAKFQETCDWLPDGRRHIICRSRFQVATGPREGLSIFSYRAADQKYVYQGFRAGGATQTLLGSVSADGKSWEFTGDEGTGPARLRTRVRISVNGDGTFRFIEQTAKGDGAWSAEEVVMYRPAR